MKTTYIPAVTPNQLVAEELRHSRAQRQVARRIARAVIGSALVLAWMVAVMLLLVGK